MEKYRLIQEQNADIDDDNFSHQRQAASNEGHGYPEVRITQQGKPRNYISYAMTLIVRYHDGTMQYLCFCAILSIALSFMIHAFLLFFCCCCLQSEGSPTISLRAMGRAINKAVTIAEILKRKIPLHQWNILSSVDMVDVYEPTEEGLDVIQSRRYVSCMTITLSIRMLSGTELDMHHYGYQPPLPASEMHPRDVQQQPSQRQHHSTIMSSK